MVDGLHPDAIRRVLGRSLGSDGSRAVAGQFAVLADPSRARILHLLAISERELCVCDMALVLGMTVPALSHQLRAPRERGAPTSRDRWSGISRALRGHLSRSARDDCRRRDAPRVAGLPALLRRRSTVRNRSNDRVVVCRVAHSATHWPEGTLDAWLKCCESRSAGGPTRGAPPFNGSLASRLWAGLDVHHDRASCNPWSSHDV